VHTATTAPVARLHGRHDVRIADEPVPEPGPGESLVRIEAVGLCGSDLHWYEEGGIGDARLDAPLVVGHEFAGVVEGGALDGRRVAVDPALPCYRCEPCLRGDRNLCLSVAFAGHGATDGALRRYLAWPDHALYPLPEGFDGVTGAMLEPLGVALHALDLGHVRIGDSAAVVGCGPIGLLVVQALRAHGARVAAAVDPLEHRRAAAVESGAEAGVAPAEVSGSVDVVFEVSGSEAAVDAAIALARPGARVVLVGIPDEDRTTFRASVARRKGLSLIVARRMKEDVYPRGIRLVEAGLLDTDRLVSHRFALADTAEAFAVAVARTGLKVVVEP